MFTIKQVGSNENGVDIGGFEKIWPSVSHVDARGGDAPGEILHVSAFFTEGGSLDFCRGEREQTIYVMNDSGSTVARYLLRGGLVATGAPLPMGA